MKGGKQVTKNTTVINVLEDVFIALGIAISVDQIKTILGIVLLCVQIVWIFVKCGISIYKKIKEKRYSEIESDINELTDEINKVTNNIENGKSNTKSK